MTEADHSAPPPWDGAQPSDSFWRYSAWLNETAKATFERDKTHVELYFLILPDGQVALGNPPPGMPRDDVAAAIRKTVGDHDIYGVIHVAETWSYLPKGANDHTYKQVVSGEIAVSELRPEDRTEALMVRMECRDGSHHMWLHPIVRTESAVTLRDALEIDQPARARFGGFFPA